MADLTIAGTSVRVRRDSWNEDEPVYQGGRVYNADNSITSTEDATTEKRRAACEIYYESWAEALAVIALAPRGTKVTVAGDLPGASLQAFVDYKGRTALLRNGVLHRAIKIAITEG